MDTEDSFINFDGEEVPFSQNVFDANGFTFGVEICEDLWTPVPPSTVLSMSGAEIILNLSASNALIGKRDYVNSMVKQTVVATLQHMYIVQPVQEKAPKTLFTVVTQLFVKTVLS